MTKKSEISTIKCVLNGKGGVGKGVVSRVITALSIDKYKHINLYEIDNNNKKGSVQSSIINHRVFQVSDSKIAIFDVSFDEGDNEILSIIDTGGSDDYKAVLETLYKNKVKNIDFELAIVENTDTPAYRLMVNDILIQLKQFDTNNQLDLRALLEAGNFPFKDQLLDYLNKREQEASEAMQNGMPLPGAQLPPELQQQLGQYQFTPEVLQQFENLPEDQRSMFEQAQ